MLRFSTKHETQPASSSHYAQQQQQQWQSNGSRTRLFPTTEFVRTSIACDRELTCSPLRLVQLSITDHIDADCCRRRKAFGANKDKKSNLSGYQQTALLWG